MTTNTSICSLLRFGLAVAGSVAYEQLLLRLDTAVINVAARRIIGVGVSARLPTLRVSAGVKSMRNVSLSNTVLHYLTPPCGPLTVPSRLDPRMVTKCIQDLKLETGNVGIKAGRYRGVKDL